MLPLQTTVIVSECRENGHGLVPSAYPKTGDQTAPLYQTPGGFGYLAFDDSHLLVLNFPDFVEKVGFAIVENLPELTHALFDVFLERDGLALDRFL